MPSVDTPPNVGSCLNPPHPSTSLFVAEYKCWIEKKDGDHSWSWLHHLGFVICLLAVPMTQVSTSTNSWLYFYSVPMHPFFNFVWDPLHNISVGSLHSLSDLLSYVSLLFSFTGFCWVSKTVCKPPEPAVTQAHDFLKISEIYIGFRRI